MSEPSARSPRERGAGARLDAGAALLALAWPLNWGLEGLRTHLLFFPLWLGYILVADGLTLRRTGSSPSRRAGPLYPLLFLVSVPLWWLFELVNWRLGNWEYLGRGRFGDFEYVLLSSLCFSTVVPAILTSAELARSWSRLERLASGPAVRGPRRDLWLVAAGLAMAGFMLAWPRYGYPLVWVSGVLVLDPIARRLGRRGLLDDLRRGDWRPVAALSLGALACGFCWELWNYWSYPKWIYHVPFVGSPKLFEMPLLGYGGYPPFALEVYLVQQIVGPRRAAPPL